MGGTGTFQGLIGGTGSIAFDSRADGGVFVSIQGSTLYGVSCPSTEVCYAVGNLGTILKGTNTWGTWSAQKSNTTQTLQAISCLDVLTCFAVGDGGVILGTVDGATWSPSSPTTANLTGINCANRAACVAVGSGVAVTYNSVLGWRLQAKQSDHQPAGAQHLPRLVSVTP